MSHHKLIGKMPSGKEVMNVLESIGGLAVGNIVATKAAQFIAPKLPANIPPWALPAAQFLVGGFVMTKSRSPFVISVAGGVAVSGLVGVGRVLAPNIINGLGMGPAQYANNPNRLEFDENKYELGNNTVLGYGDDSDRISW